MTPGIPLTLADLDSTTLTASQAFRAMGKFLAVYFDETHGQGIVRTLVGDVEIESDGSSTDPGALTVWRQCIVDVLAEKRADPNVLSPEEAFETMFEFLDGYWREFQTARLADVLGDLNPASGGGSSDPAMWPDWLKASERVVGRRN